MHNKHLILHLTLLENIGPAIIQKIMNLQRSGTSVSDLYLFSQVDWQQACGFTDAIAHKLVTGLANKKILAQELDLIAYHNIEWAIVEDETYPQLLREIYLPPAVIYWQGASLSVDNNLLHTQKIISVVGARKANDYGERVVNAIVPELVTAGYTIVSGGALGIDTMAHVATMRSGGSTIAVLGSGLLCAYPSSNKYLFKSIVEHGGSMVSSFPLGMAALPGHFPARNRIITGLSRGCLVVQAAKKSGALISAHYALEQGREVFAVPGLIGDELSAGCNALIQNGAKLVMSAADILEEFGDRLMLPDTQIIEHKAQQMPLESMIPAKKTEKIILDPFEHYSSVQKKIIAACKQQISFDSLLDITQLTHELLQAELFNLQLDGVVSQDFIGMWAVVHI